MRAWKSMNAILLRMASIALTQPAPETDSNPKQRDLVRSQSRLTNPDRQGGDHV